jgi:hypothetical protein
MPEDLSVEIERGETLTAERREDFCPSVTGVAEAWPFLMDVLDRLHMIAVSQRISPSVGGRERESFRPSPAPVRKMRSPKTMGEEFPLPGTATFQRTFLEPDHSSG